jgi:protein SCO1/2
MPEDITTKDFTLTDQNDQPFTLSKQKGQVVLMFFGYTFCPDVCPMTLSTFVEVKKGLKEQAQNVKFVYITVDPERDTPKRMKNHLINFDTEFVGLTGDIQTLEKVYNAYGVYRDRNDVEGSEGVYFMSHTSNIFVIDRSGKWRLLFNYGTSSEDMIHDIQLLLQ